MPPIFIERAITPGSRNLLRRRPQVHLNDSGTWNSLSSCFLHVYYTPSQLLYPLRTSQSCSPSCSHHPLVSEMPLPFAAHSAFAKNAPGAPISSLYLGIMPLRHTLLSDIATERGLAIAAAYIPTPTSLFHTTSLTSTDNASN